MWGGRWLAPARVGKVALAGLLAAVGFLLATPSVLLDLERFTAGFAFQWRAVSGSRYFGLSDSVHRLFVNLLPAGLGWGLLALAVGGGGWLALKRRRAAGEILVGAWLLAFLLIALLAGRTTTVGRLLPFLVMLILPAVGWLATLWGRSGLRRRWLAGGLTIVVGLMTLADALWLDAYFATDRVRADASRWLEAHVPAGADVGLCRDPWWFSPDIIATEFYQPGVTGHRYQLQIHQYSAPALQENPTPYIVLAGQELGNRFEESPEPTKAEFRAWLMEHYEPVASFRTTMPGWGLFRDRIPSGIYAPPDILVLQKRAAP